MHRHLTNLHIINYKYPLTMLNWQNARCHLIHRQFAFYQLALYRVSMEKNRFPTSSVPFFWSSLGNFPFKCQINLSIHCVSKLWSVLRLSKRRLSHMLHLNPRFLAQSWRVGILLCQYSIEPRVPFIFKYSSPKNAHHSNFSSSLSLTNCKLF